MDCSCTIGGGEYDCVTTLSLKRVKARKPTKCTECGDSIIPGDTYTRDTYVWENKIHTSKRCMACDTLLKSMFPNGFIYGTLTDSLYDFVVGLAGEVSSSCILKVPEPGRSKLFEIIEYVWDREFTK